MSKKAKQRVFWRTEPGRQSRAYGNFRDFKPWGGGRREPLMAPGETRATTDSRMAERLAGQRLEELQRRKDTAQGRKLSGLPDLTPLQAFAALHLVAKQSAGKVTHGWMEGEELRLERAVEFLGGDTDLSSIKVADVRKWNEALTKQGLSGGTRRQHLNSLSNLFRRAMAEEKATFNPVSAMMEKPSAQSQEAHWLTVPEAALLLEAARTFVSKRRDVAVPYALPLIATCLLTGGRPSEVLGLEVDDVSFDRKLVTFRPNSWRRLKTLSSRRSVPMWPQLEAILREYVFGDRPPTRLLFPSWRTGQESMLTDCRKTLDGIGKRIGYKKRELNLYDFRHTYCAARLQTLDGNAPVSPYTVGKELGHGGSALVNRIYGHLGEVRHRSSEVEYRVEQHKKVKHLDRSLGDWTNALVPAAR